MLGQTRPFSLAYQEWYGTDVMTHEMELHVPTRCLATGYGIGYGHGDLAILFIPYEGQGAAGF